MCAPFQMHHSGSMTPCGCSCACGDLLSMEEEIKKLEVFRQHLQFQLEMIERRIRSFQEMRG